MIAEILSHREELEELCRRFHVRRLDLFGSATGDDFDSERSDLDFLVEFDPRAPGGYADAFFGDSKNRWNSFSAGRWIWSPPQRFAIPISERALRAPGSRCMRREAKGYLHDVAQAAEMIAQFTSGRTFQDYLEDPMLRAAVERKFEIIGEALAQLAKHKAQRQRASASTGG
jgi:hypothetical protein